MCPFDDPSKACPKVHIWGSYHIIMYVALIFARVGTKNAAASTFFLSYVNGIVENVHIFFVSHRGYTAVYSRNRDSTYCSAARLWYNKNFPCKHFVDLTNYEPICVK